MNSIERDSSRPASSSGGCSSFSGFRVFRTVIETQPQEEEKDVKREERERSGREERVEGSFKDGGREGRRE